MIRQSVEPNVISTEAFLWLLSLLICKSIKFGIGFDGGSLKIIRMIQLHLQHWSASAAGYS